MVALAHWGHPVSDHAAANRHDQWAVGAAVETEAGLWVWKQCGFWEHVKLNVNLESLRQIKEELRGNGQSWKLLSGFLKFVYEVSEYLWKCSLDRCPWTNLSLHHL